MLLEIARTDDYRHGDPFRQRSHETGVLNGKPKYYARRVFRDFSHLSPEEQFVVVRLFRTHSYYGSNDPLMHLDQRSPYYGTLRNLIRKRWITPYVNFVGVPWHTNYTFFPASQPSSVRCDNPTDLIAKAGDIYSDSNVEQWSFSNQREPTDSRVRHCLAKLGGDEAIRKGFYKYFGLV